MKTEDFDEAIRKKLESLNQTYTESEIDKVYHHVMSKRNFLWKGFKGSWLFYSLSAAAFTVAGIWMVSHFKNNEQPHPGKQIQNKEINTIQADTVRVADDTLNTATVLKAVPSLPLSQKPQPATSMAAGIKPGKAIPVPKNTSVEPTILKQSNPAIGNEIISPNPLPEPVQENIKASSGVAEPVLETPAEKPVQNAAPVLEPTAKISRETPVTPQVQAVSNPEPAQQAPFIKTGIPANDFKESQDSIRPDQTVKPGKTTGGLFSGAQVRAGTDFQLSKQSFGMGVSGELLLKNHFSILGGLNYNALRPEHFADKADLFMHKHHDFNPRIEDHLAGRDHLSSISLANRLLQIPVSLRYYVPLKRNYSVNFSLGTDLDIYISQKLSYNHQPDTGMMGKNNFIAKGNASLLNNMVISAGLEKRWKSLAFELQPYLSPQLKQVFYKPKQIEFGLDVGIKYGF